LSKNTKLLQILVRQSSVHPHFFIMYARILLKRLPDKRFRIWVCPFNATMNGNFSPFKSHFMSENFKVLFLLKKGREVNPVSLPFMSGELSMERELNGASKENARLRSGTRKSAEPQAQKNRQKILNSFLDVGQAQIFQIRRESFKKRNGYLPA